jgi:arginyl-tRNA synthetase
MLRDWEAGDEEVMKLWKKVVGWAYEGHLRTFKRLGEEPGHMWYESELYKKGRDIIQSHMGKGVVEKLPDGAVVGRLEDTYGIPDVILLRSDGTSLYHTQDIYLTMQKIEKFHPWHAVWVVGNEQITHFQQLYALLDALGILSYESLYHFAYGLVVDSDGTKLGKNAADATADALLDQMKEAASDVIEQRNIDVEVEDEDAVAESVGIAALRYAFLSRDPFKNIVYDPESAVSFTGKSGPYIMYTYARAKSVLRKALGEKIADYGVREQLDLETSNIEISKIEREVLLRLLMYPEVVLSAANKYAPNIIADYLYDTASSFNNLYEKLTIAGAEGEQKRFRLALTKLLTTVLADGMTILGMDVLERM